VLRRVDGCVAHRLHVRILQNSADVIGVEVLPPVITRLREQHPDLAVELVLTDRVRNSPRCRVTFDALVKGLQQHLA